MHSTYVFFLLQRRSLFVYHVAFKMISDVQLALFANVLGVLVFVLVVLYHYVAANNPKKITKP